MSGSTGGGGSLGCCLQHAVLAYHGIVQSFWQTLCVYCGQLCAACYAVGCVWVAAIALCLVLGKHELANYLCNVCEPVWLVSASIRAQQNAHKVVAVSASLLAMLLAVCVWCRPTVSAAQAFSDAMQYVVALLHCVLREDTLVTSLQRAVWWCILGQTKAASCVFECYFWLKSIA